IENTCHLLSVIILQDGENLIEGFQRREQRSHIVFPQLLGVERDVGLPNHVKDRGLGLRGVEIVIETGLHAFEGFSCQGSHRLRRSRLELSACKALLKVTQLLNITSCSAKAVKRKVQLIAIWHRRQQKADGRGFMSLEHQITQRKKITEAL